MLKWASLVAQPIKNLPAMRETWVRSPGEGNGYSTAIFSPREFNGLYSPWGRRVGHN